MADPALAQSQSVGYKGNSLHADVYILLIYQANDIGANHMGLLAWMP